MAQLEQRIAQMVNQLTREGLTVVNQKPLPYGQQLIVSNGIAKVNINVYQGKKGISTVIGGSATSGLRQQISAILEHGTKNSAPSRTVTYNAQHPYGFEDVDDFDFHWIGTDESGKGDCFGPLVVAGVMVDATIAARLEEIGVRDSKQLNDARIYTLAQAIREICERRFVELELMPAKYNELYRQLQTEGKNLNHLLAWGHARVLEELLSIAPCRFALADQFANEKYIEAQLFAKGRTITLKQAHRAEQNVAVAAASILARDRFVARMQQLEAEFGQQFPKGASTSVTAAARQFVTKHGAISLSKVAKLHFRTFEQFS